MPLDDINALLAALKQKEGGGGLSSADDSEPDDSGAPEVEGSEEDTEEDNGKIVAALQDQYPQIYAKLSKQIEAEDDGSSDTGDSSSLPDDMNDMSSMMK